MLKTIATTLFLFALASEAYALQHTDQDLKQLLIGHEYSGTPWVFENENEFSNFLQLREETRGKYKEYFIYMSLSADNACHNTLGLITIDTGDDKVMSVDMVHHAPAKKCLSYTEFKNP